MDILAPAKVNLTLAVMSRRADGYHELATVMQKVDLCDRLSLKKIDAGVSIRCLDARGQRGASPVPEDERNIAHRAAVAFLAQGAVHGGVAITLEKHIPIAAGLGGGSSDAAAVLLGLNQLYGAEVDEETLLGMAKTLGADVPFFVAAGDAYFAGGIGELLHPIPPLRRCWLVLVNPGFPVATKWVYDNFALTSGHNPYTLGRGLPQLADADCFAEMIPSLAERGVARFYNDLERVTISRFPELEAVKRGFLEDGACFSLMSGSGPTMFGIFTDEEKAKGSHQRFSRRYSRVDICRPFGRQTAPVLNK